MNIFETRLKPIKPSQSNFAEILSDPKASAWRLLFWIMVGAVTPSLVNLLVIMINQLLQSGSTELLVQTHRWD